MRKVIRFAGLGAMLVVAASGFSQSSSPAKVGGSGDIVIVFKDGHRQSFHLAEVARVEFSGAATTTADVDVANPGMALCSRRTPLARVAGRPLLSLTTGR